MKIYLLSYPDFFKGEAEAINSLMAEFKFTFHLRKPNAHAGEYDDILKQIKGKYHPRIVLHGAYSLQEQYNIKGLHFSTQNRAIKNSIDVKGTCSTSCHAVKEAKQLDGRYNYMFLSPVFESISKSGYTGKLNMSAVNTMLHETHKTKIIALGGISKYTLPSLKKYQFDGIGLLGTVWTNHPESQPDFTKNLKTINQCL